MQEEETAMQVTELSQTECYDVLAHGRVARLACAQDNQPYVVPITYAYAENCLFGFSMPGRKIDILSNNPAVAILVEDYAKTSWRSVLVEGRFEALSEEGDTAPLWQKAWELISRLPDWWEPGALKPKALPLSDHSPHLFYRVPIRSLTGRHFLTAVD